MALQFSKDGKYFAFISTDGKLKIWDTLSNSFEQEFTPDYHLTSPCTCLHFLPAHGSNSGASPKKKKRRESSSSSCPNLVLGSTTGTLLVYSISSANLECTINSETSQSINCLSTVDSSIVYSGADQNIFIWSLPKQKLLKKWKGGNEKITSILAIPDSNQILTASKSIKLWDVDAKEVLQNFTGHSSDVTFLQYINPRGTDDAYFISGSKGDRLLSCWSLSTDTSNKNAVASFLMEDIVYNVSVNIANDGSTNLAVTVRSGVVHIYRHTLNGKCTKPFKPKTTLQVVSDTGQSDTVVTPIRIMGAIYRDDETLCIGHGTELMLTFENIEINSYKKIQCLVRKDPRTVSTSKEENILKTRTPIVTDDVQYLTPQTSSSTTKRKSEGTMEIPMEKRLENLTLKIDSSSGVPRFDNLAQLLIQGLHSKDQNILRTVLCKRDDNVIRSTVKRLPVSVLVPLIEELKNFIQGKTLSSQIGCLWLKHILQVHASILMSNPELQELLGPLLGSIESRLTLLTPLHKLKGRLGLLISQVSNSNNSSIEGLNDNEEPLLIFDDKDSSESDEEDVNK